MPETICSDCGKVIPPGVGFYLYDGVSDKEGPFCQQCVDLKRRLQDEESGRRRGTKREENT